MNVLHLDEQRGWRGGEQQASYLIEGLAARGHTCLIAGRPGSEFLNREHGGGVTSRFALPFRGELDLYTAWRIAAIARRHNADIVHAHTSHTHTLACLARFFGASARIVVSRRVDFVPKPGALNRWKYNAPDRTIAISEAIRAILVRYGLPEKRVACVHSGIDVRRFNVPPTTRAAIGVPQDELLIGNVAALVGHKDHATLIRAFALVRDALPAAHLVIAGEGDLRPDIESLIAELGLRDGVTLLGYRTDVPAILPLFDLFVLSSREEGLGTAVLDAMACGVPVVATNGGGIPEMVRDGETGLLAPRESPEALAHAILRAAGDAVLRQRCASAARALVDADFSVDAMVEGNLAVYSTLVGG